MTIGGLVKICNYTMMVVTHLLIIMLVLLRMDTSTSGIMVQLDTQHQKQQWIDNLTVTGTSNLVGTLSLNGTDNHKTDNSN